MKTYSVKASDIKREWHIIDASDEILGKLATRVARLLSGKHKPLFARNMDVGDFVVVINASKIRFTGKKAEQKMYYRHSQYPGGLRSEKLEELVEKYPERIIEHAVKGMLPRNRLNARMMKRLRIFTGADNPYGKPPSAVAPVSETGSN
ncbi:MAG: 50S ribosomal protein L13 [Dehalococcoidales bacterium]|nr:50S ribosomal protein L13 [Dehalococcoidales bacterium]